MLTRRHMLGAALASAMPATLTARAAAAASPELPFPASSLGQIRQAGLRGSIDTAGGFVMPDAGSTGSRKFSKALRQAAASGKPVFLPPGTYRIATIDLPDMIEISGVPGATRIEYTGDGYLFRATGLGRIRLSGLTIDGNNAWLADQAGGLIHCIGVGQVEIEGCEISGSVRNAIHLEGCGGEIRGNRLSGAADAGVYAVESKGLAIRDNTVSGCGNGGILVHRYRKAEDGTIVSGNRVTGILSRAGGTGQNGNGINVFRAGNVMISNNFIADCAFSAIRSNAGSGVQISSNQCLRSGETALYSEFGFEGAVVSGNVIDGAANGISVVNFNEGGRLATISGNVVRNITAAAPYPAADAGFGMGITAEADTVISANVIDTTGKWGLLLGWGPYLRNVVATGNMIRSAPVGCAVSVAEGAGSALIAENTFSNIIGEAVAGYRWNDRATGELAIDGAPGFTSLTIERNRIS